MCRKQNVKQSPWETLKAYLTKVPFTGALQGGRMPRKFTRTPPIVFTRQQLGVCGQYHCILGSRSTSGVRDSNNWSRRMQGLSLIVQVEKCYFQCIRCTVHSQHVCGNSATRMCSRRGCIVNYYVLLPQTYSERQQPHPETRENWFIIPFEGANSHRTCNGCCSRKRPKHLTSRTFAPRARISVSSTVYRIFTT